MADGLTVQVRGADTLARTAAAAADDLRDLAQVNRAAASAVASAARPPRRTGRLAASIGVQDVSATEATVGTSIVYGAVIEYGWPAHGIEARYYLADAADASWQTVQNLYADAVDDAIRHVKGT